MNKRRKVLITITYNEMGIIIDTKAEEVAQPNLQSTCNELATDCISRQAAIDEIVTWLKDRMTDGKNGKPLTDRIKDLPSTQPEVLACGEGVLNAQPELIRCKDCKHYEWMSNRVPEEQTWHCHCWNADTGKDDFCSYGERKDGEA